MRFKNFYCEHVELKLLTETIEPDDRAMSTDVYIDVFGPRLTYLSRQLGGVIRMMTKKVPVKAYFWEARRATHHDMGRAMGVWPYDYNFQMYFKKAEHPKHPGDGTWMMFADRGAEGMIARMKKEQPALYHKIFANYPIGMHQE